MRCTRGAHPQFGRTNWISTEPLPQWRQKAMNNDKKAAGSYATFLRRHRQTPKALFCQCCWIPNRSFVGGAVWGVLVLPHLARQGKLCLWGTSLAVVTPGCPAGLQSEGWALVCFWEDSCRKKVCLKRRVHWSVSLRFRIGDWWIPASKVFLISGWSRAGFNWLNRGVYITHSSFSTS